MNSLAILCKQRSVLCSLLISFFIVSTPQETPTSGAKRLLLAELSKSSLMLAEERAYRKDPLNGFNRYTGGWNISHPHYWASVAYSGAPFFIVAGAWFVIFGVCLLIVALYYCCCCPGPPNGYSRIVYALSLISLILFTVAAIIGCIVLYTGKGKFHSSSTNALHYVVDQANKTAETLKDVSEYLAAAKRIGVDQVLLPANMTTGIDEIQKKINSSAITLATRTADNSDDIEHVIESVRLTLIILSAIMLLIMFIGFIFSIFGVQSFVYILVIITWILVTGTFILCGVFLVLHNVTADTCVAMNEWVQNPTAHTALDDILPCVENTTAQETLNKSKEVTSQLVNLINQVITNVSNVNFTPAFVTLYYNQSGPLLPTLCKPFNPDLTDRKCSSGEVDLNNATKVWKKFVCEVSSSGICITTGRLSPTIYSQMASGVNVSYGLYHYGPFLVSLLDCSFLKGTFTDVHTTYCPGLWKYSRYTYIGLLLVSGAGMLSILLWVIYGRERRHRVYTKEHAL